MQKHFFEKSTAIYFAIVNQKKLILISTTLRINIPPPRKKKTTKKQKNNKKSFLESKFSTLKQSVAAGQSHLVSFLIESVGWQIFISGQQRNTAAVLH